LVPPVPGGPLPPPNQGGVSGIPGYNAMVAGTRDQGLSPPNLQARAPLPGEGGLLKPQSPEMTAQGSGVESPLQPNPALRKAQAQQLLVQARALQKENKLIDARAKAIEAQKLGAPFGPLEDSPELALQQLAVQTRQHIDVLLRNATEVAM